MGERIKMAKLDVDKIMAEIKRNKNKLNDTTCKGFFF